MPKAKAALVEHRLLLRSTAAHTPLGSLHSVQISGGQIIKGLGFSELGNGNFRTIHARLWTYLEWVVFLCVYLFLLNYSRPILCSVGEPA